MLGQTFATQPNTCQDRVTLRLIQISSLGVDVWQWELMFREYPSFATPLQNILLIPQFSTGTQLPGSSGVQPYILQRGEGKGRGGGS